MNTVERFFAKVSMTDTCWQWTAALQTSGYGFFQGQLAHRLAYELMIGPIPPGLTIDHLCGCKTCVNPAHMEVVTRAENTRRQMRARRMVGAAS